MKGVLGLIGISKFDLGKVIFLRLTDTIRHPWVVIGQASIPNFPSLCPECCCSMLCCGLCWATLACLGHAIQLTCHYSSLAPICGIMCYHGTSWLMPVVVAQFLGHVPSHICLPWYQIGINSSCDWLYGALCGQHILFWRIKTLGNIWMRWHRLD
jgi:hypothetical protein